MIVSLYTTCMLMPSHTYEHLEHNKLTIERVVFETHQVGTYIRLHLLRHQNSALFRLVFKESCAAPLQSHCVSAYVQRSPRLPRHHVQAWCSIRLSLPLGHNSCLASILVSTTLVSLDPSSRTITLAFEKRPIEASRAPCPCDSCL